MTRVSAGMVRRGAGITFIALAILTPLLYLRVSDFRTFHTREGVVLVIAFAGCLVAGISLLRTQSASQLPKNNITNPAPVNHTRPKQVHHLRPRSENEIIPSQLSTSPKPDLNKVVEDLKNYLKLEAWALALQKANEIIHYYPGTPEAEKVRSNLSFLTQKVKELNR